MSIVGTPEWNEYARQYVEARAAAAANGFKGWEHADCDHGSGYCAATVSNTFEPNTARDSGNR